jgi:cell division protein FtsA
MLQSNILTVIDLGSSKVSMACVKISGQEVLEVLGFASLPASGLKRGTIVNIEMASRSILSVLNEVQSQVGHKIKSAYVSVSGDHICSMNSLGVVPIRQNDVSETDVERVIESARAVPMTSDQRVLHVVPQEYTVDKQKGIRDPLGMCGVRLEAWIHLICGDESPIQNITKCIQVCDLKLDGLILEPLASSQAMVTDDEKEYGVCAIDIGSGTSSVTIYRNGALLYTSVLPIAGDQVTSDIALALKVSNPAAEVLKVENGSLLPSDAGSEEIIQVQAMVQSKVQSVTKGFLVQIINARYKEIFEMIKRDINHHNPTWLPSLGAGVVLTGGGSLVEGIEDLAQSVLLLPTRSLSVRDSYGDERMDSPTQAALVGLIKYCLSQHKCPVTRSTMGRSFKRLREWLDVNF